MSGAFLAIALAAAVLLVNWRLVVVAALAGLIAFVVIGMGFVNTGAAGEVGPPAITPTQTTEQPTPSPAEVVPPR